MSEKPLVLFLTDRGEFHQQSALQDAPPQLEVAIRRRPALDELRPLLPRVQFIISERSEVVSAELIAACPALRGIVRLGSLLVGIDEAAARARNIPISMQPVVGTIYVAEHCLMMTLAALKHLARSLWQANSAEHGKTAKRGDENTFSFNWLGLTDIGGLYQKTVGILGMGEIGVEYARRVRAFAPAAVVYNKRQRYPEEIEGALGITFAERDALFAQSDVLLSLLPYAPELDLSLNAAAFARLRPGAVVIHAGSGSIIDERALIANLQSGQLSGAALDTYEYEPLPPDHPLVAYARDPRSNLLLTPHTAAASLPPGRAEDYAEIVRLLNGEVLRFRA